jgi:murein DD-endopeptidase MepM/ murein hydrolase activator NlpD
MNFNPLGAAHYTVGQGPWEQDSHGRGTHHPGQIWQNSAAVDLLVPHGTPVYAPVAGKIAAAGRLSGSEARLEGIRIGIQGNPGLPSVYLAHLSALASGIAVGQQVTAGQFLGYTGRAGGVDHLHFAITKPDTPYFSPHSHGADPRDFLKDADVDQRPHDPGGRAPVRPSNLDTFRVEHGLTPEAYKGAGLDFAPSDADMSFAPSDADMSGSDGSGADMSGSDGGGGGG